MSGRLQAHRMRLIVLLLVTASAASCDTTVLTTELANLKELRNRLVIPFGAGRLVWTDVRGSGDAPEWTIGWSGPRLLFGPVRPAGLLREIRSPLRYSPGSGVLEEASGYLPDTAFRASRSGVLVTGISPETALFLVKTPRRISCGSLLRISSSRIDPPSTELLLEASEPAIGAGSDEWYGGGSAVGLLLHGAARVGWRSPRLSTVLSASVSGGEWTCPGGFLHGSLRVRRGGWEGDLLAGIASRGYLTPDGARGDWARLFGIRTGRCRGQSWKTGAEYCIRIAPPRGRLSGFRVSEESGFAFLRTGGMVCPMVELYPWFRLDVRRRFDTSGDSSARVNAATGIEARGRGVDFRIDVYSGADEGRPESGLAIAFESRIKSGAAARMALTLADGGEATLDLEFETPSFRLRLSLPPSGPQILLRWEIEGRTVDLRRPDVEGGPFEAVRRVRAAPWP